MPKLDLDVGDVAVHCATTGALVVHSFKINTGKLCSFPISGHIVALLEGSEEVLSMLAACVMNPEVVNNQDKGYWLPFVPPKPRGGGALVVPVCKKALGEEVIGKLTCLFEPIHAFGELVVYPAIVGILLKFILVDNFLGNYTELNLRIFRSIEGSVEVEVGEVGCHIFGPRCGEGAVDNQLDSFEGPCLCSTIAGVVDGVATNGDVGLVGICFCWMHLADNTGVCDIALAFGRYILEFDGLHGICA